MRYKQCTVLLPFNANESQCGINERKLNLKARTYKNTQILGECNLRRVPYKHAWKRVCRIKMLYTVTRESEFMREQKEIYQRTLQWFQIHSYRYTKNKNHITILE